MVNFNYSNDYFKLLKSDWNKRSFKIILKYANKGIKIFKPKILLDLGCGNGIYLSVFKKNNILDIYGIDLSEESIEQCKKLGYTEVLKSNAESLPYKNNSFDMVFSSEVLEHVENYEKMLSEIHRILKDKGGMVLTTTCYTTSIFTFIRAPKNGLGLIGILKEILKYFKGYINPNIRKEFIHRWCLKPLGGHFHGFIPRKLIKTIKSLGFQIIKYGVFFAFEPIPLGQNRWIRKSFSKSTNWHLLKRMIAIPLAILLIFINSICKLLRLFGNNVYVIAQK